MMCCIIEPLKFSHYLINHRAFIVNSIEALIFMFQSMSFKHIPEDQEKFMSWTCSARKKQIRASVQVGELILIFP